MKEEYSDKSDLRIQISLKLADTLKIGARLLGIDVPERM
jgi:arginyl-tRNA synthetase